MQSPTCETKQQWNRNHLSHFSFLYRGKKPTLQMLPLLEFSFYKTVSLVNSHAGSGTVAFVLTRTGSPPLLIMEIKEITHLLSAYTTPYIPKNSIT